MFRIVSLSEAVCTSVERSGSDGMLNEAAAAGLPDDEAITRVFRVQNNQVFLYSFFIQPTKKSIYCCTGAGIPLTSKEHMKTSWSLTPSSQEKKVLTLCVSSGMLWKST